MIMLDIPNQINLYEKRAIIKNCSIMWSFIEN